MSDEKKEDVVEEEAPTRDPDDAPDMGTAWGRFVSQKDTPGTPSHMVHGLLSEAHPDLQDHLMQDFEKLLGVNDVFNNLMEQIFSTPEGRRQFERELEKRATKGRNE